MSFMLSPTQQDPCLWLASDGVFAPLNHRQQLRLAAATHRTAERSKTPRGTRNRARRKVELSPTQLSVLRPDLQALKCTLHALVGDEE